MSLNEKIAAKQAELAQARTRLEDVTKQDDFKSEDLVAATKSVEDLDAELQTLLAAEAAVKKSAGSAAVIVKHDPSAKVSNDEAIDLLVKSATATLMGYHAHESAEGMAQKMFGDNERLAGVMSVTKAANANAVNPAMTNVAGWAQELTRQAYGAFIDLLRDTSVIPAMPFGMNLQFQGFSNIYLPTRDETAGNLAGEFRKEGDPIPVKKLGFKSKVLSPKSLGVISHFTQEMLDRSTPNIEQIVRAAMVQDTAEALDTAFLGAAAADAVKPAGLQALAVAADKNASSGSTVENIHNDLAAMVKRLAGHKLGSPTATRWVMNPAQFYTLKLARNAMGVYLYPETGANNLLGFPVVISTNVPAGVVFLVDASQIAFAGGMPRFAASTEATLHESNPAAAIVDNGATATVAQPVRSLFQTNTLALRATWELDWDIVRSGCIQALTGCTW